MTHTPLFALALGLASPAFAQTPDRVEIGSFAIDRTEVRIGAFRAFAEATALETAAERDGGGYEFTSGWTQRPGWTWAAPYGEPGAEDEPAVHVSWDEAQAFCAAAGGRLPTYEEWRSAAYTEARPTPTAGFETGRTYEYPVGDNPEGMNNNRERHVPVGTTKEGVNGLYDMGANVWEWVADRQGDSALTAGGSWWYGPENTRDGRAQWKPADFYAVYVGFRCAYDLEN
jgi:formylglycine-generating enzyme